MTEENYILNKIISQENSATQLVAINSILISAYVAFMASSLGIEAIRAVLNPIEHLNRTITSIILILPLIFWLLSIGFCSRILNFKKEKIKNITDNYYLPSFLLDKAQNKQKLLNWGYLFVIAGFFIIIFFTLIAISFQLNIAETWENRGDDHLFRSQYNEALEDYDKATEIDPQLASAWNSKGYILNEMGNYKEAIKYLNKSLDIDENFVNAWNNKGIACRGLGNYPDAIYCFNRSLSIDNTHAISWYNMGNVYLELFNYDEAIRCYNNATKYNSRYLKAWRALSSAYEKSGDHENAKKASDRAKEL